MSPEFKETWEVVLMPEADAWFKALRTEERMRMAAAFEQLEQVGPNKGRPLVDRIKGSRYHKMKELRSTTRHERGLFIFDGDRRGVVLVGGNKQGIWDRWYLKFVPKADKIYARYLRDGGKGVVPWRTSHREAGRRSAGRAN
jgi:hypothetical protein